MKKGTRKPKVLRSPPSETRPILLDRAASILSPPVRQSVWQWAESNIVLSDRVSPRPGPYRTEWCPYVREPQEAFTDPEVESIVLCWASRTSKTETLLNCIRYSMAVDPQSVLIVQPTAQLAESFSETRLQPSIDDSPILAAEKPANPDHYRLKEMHMKRCDIWLAGANSPAELKGRGVATLLCDEVDTWRSQGNKETGALELALDRTKDRWNRKHLIGSTPTIESGQIWREFQRGDQRYFHVPCPHCGHEQRLVFDQIKWAPEAKKGDAWDFEAVRESTYYECAGCKGKIDDIHKAMMLKQGKWVASVPAADKRRRSYHLNSLYPEWIPFADIAVMFLQTKGDREAFQRFVNAWLSEPFIGYATSAQLEAVLKANMAKENPAGVPKGWIALMFVDVQQDNVWFVVRAFSENRDSILLEYGSAPTFEDAEEVGKKWGIFCGGMDRRFRHVKVLEWCATHPGWYPILGAAGMRDAFRWVHVPIDGGALKGRDVHGINVRSFDFREEWYHRVNKIGENRPKWEIRPDASQDYRHQLNGELRMVKKGIVEWVKRWANHYFDCEVDLLAMFEAVRPFAFAKKAEAPKAPPDMTEKIAPSSGEAAAIWRGENTKLW